MHIYIYVCRDTYIYIYMYIFFMGPELLPPVGADRGAPDPCRCPWGGVRRVLATMLLSAGFAMLDTCSCRAKGACNAFKRSLRSLMLGCEFNQSPEGTQLPISLRSSTFGNTFNLSLGSSQPQPEPGGDPTTQHGYAFNRSTGAWRAANYPTP